MLALLKDLQQQCPDINFQAGATFLWSPSNKHVIYKESVDEEDTVASWSLLHETGHALLDHSNYSTDFELLLMEVSAWSKAKELAARFNITIDEDHIQDCLDTYRDWLYQRSTCPGCTNCSLQIDNRTYSCFNCATVWHVSKSRMCRPYRRRHVNQVV
jgi:hypothetical protein